MAIKRLTKFADVYRDSNAANTIFGLDGNDTIFGNGGNDVIDGGAGRDTMNGGAGNDTYYVDSAGDKVVEGVGKGFDLVRSSISFVMSANVDYLELTGSGKINATGNDLGNSITGNSAANRIDGGAGTDVLTGGAGNDTLIGGAGEDVLWADAGSDVLTGGSGVFDMVDYAAAAQSAVVLVDGIFFCTGVAVNLLSGRGRELKAGTTDKLSGIEIVLGSKFGDLIVGDGADNILVGAGGSDGLSGGAGRDRLIGGRQNDFIRGGSGQDSMMGGGDGSSVLGPVNDLATDNFMFGNYDNDANADSGKTKDTMDSIYGFEVGIDKINLSEIDAVVGGGNDAFAAVIRTIAPTSEQETIIHIVGFDSAKNTTVIGIDRGNDGNMADDFWIGLVGADYTSTLKITDFVL